MRGRRTCSAYIEPFRLRVSGRGEKWQPGEKLPPEAALEGRQPPPFSNKHRKLLPDVAAAADTRFYRSRSWWTPWRILLSADVQSQLDSCGGTWALAALDESVRCYSGASELCCFHKCLRLLVGFRSSSLSVISLTSCKFLWWLKFWGGIGFEVKFIFL